MSTVGTREGYERWAARYDESPNPLLALESRTLLPLLPDLENHIAIDAGCGTGRWSLVLRERGAHVIAIDLSRAMLAQAARKGELHGTLVQGDAAWLPLPGACADLVLSSLTLSYLDDPTAALAGWSRVLRPGGILLASDFHPEATRHGWRRAFREGGETFEIESHAVPLEELRHAVPASGFSLESLTEASFGEPEIPIFEAAGKAAQFRPLSRIPAVWALRAIRR